MLGAAARGCRVAQPMAAYTHALPRTRASILPPSPHTHSQVALNGFKYYTAGLNQHMAQFAPLWTNFLLEMGINLPLDFVKGAWGVVLAWDAV